MKKNNQDRNETDVNSAVNPDLLGNIKENVKPVIPKEFQQSNLVYNYMVIFVMACVLIAGSAIVIWDTHQETNEMTRRAALTDAEHFISTVSQFRTFYSNVVVPTAKESGMLTSHDYKNKDNTIPLPATFAKDFGHTLATEDSNVDVRLYSDIPFPWRKNEKLDVFEINALNALRKNPQETAWSFETMNGVPVLRYAKADVLKESCVACHNSYPGTPKTDWKKGDVRGVLEVIRPMADFNFASQGIMKRSIVEMAVLIIFMLSLLFFVLRKLITSGKITQKAFEASEEANISLTEQVAQRKKIAARLQASDVKMRAIVNSVQEVIIVINKQGIITECNNSIEPIFGYTQEEILGKNVSLLMTGEYNSKHDKYIMDFVTKKSHGRVMKQTREFQARRKNGEIFPIELFVNDARVGDEVMFTGSIRDITHRKQTEEITYRAHQAAVDSANMKSEFLANMSHEIRTPMNGVIGMTEMLLLSELDDEQQDLAYTVKESAESLLVIINDILDFSKIEAGKMTLKKNQFHLLHMIEASIDLLAKEADNKNVEMAFFIDKKVPMNINGDAGRLRQILINLFNNALKFTEHGQVILKIHMLDDSTMKFAITDTGIGIPKDALDTLFESFSQVDSSSSREHGGTGLGLAICKQLVDLMDGKMGVESTKNVGSTFWFTIKIDEIQGEIKPYIDVPSKVLMFNTSDLLNRNYKAQMKQWNMESLAVNNLNRFVTELDNNQYDMLALDADCLYVDSSVPESLNSVIKTIRSKSSAVIVLYTSLKQYKKIETQLKIYGNNQNIHLLHKPLKHTDIKSLFNSLNQPAIEVKPTNVKDKSTSVLEQIDKKFKQDRSKETDVATTTENAPVSKDNSNKEVISKTKNASLEKETGYKVLVAEDNMVNQKVALAILGKLGHEVTIAYNGTEAVEKVSNEVFDMVLMDCQMPEMDGFEATRNIRKLPKHHHSQNIPIAAFTANAMKEDDIKCKAAGMDDYLSKPIQMQELENIFKRWSEEMDERKKNRLEPKTKQMEPA